MKEIQKPQPGEYPSYASIYIDLVPDDGNLLTLLTENLEATKKLVRSISPEKLLFRYAVGKWTIKEVLVHIVDDERIYSYRALRFARNDKTQLPGFDQDRFSLNSNANERSMENIMDEYAAVRRATIALFSGFDDASLTRSGIADNKQATVRALGYHIAGHEMHHINIIKNKYLRG
jgi:uncharacterized damage-inducible protein DinB